MFTRLETKWNAHTPVYLHNGTKENYIFQLTLTAVILVGIFAKDRLETRRTYRRYNVNLES